MDDWYNDAEHTCSTCGMVFKVYCLDDAPTVHFCPGCASSELDKDYNDED